MKTMLRNLLLALLLGQPAFTALAAETNAQETGEAAAAVSPAMQKSMDPNVWIRLMNSLASGGLEGQPLIASCIECHTDEDIARYQKDYGGMLHAMNPMMQMANPQMMGGMMAPMTGMMAPMTGMMAPMGGMMSNPMGMNSMMSDGVF